MRSFCRKPFFCIVGYIKTYDYGYLGDDRMVQIVRNEPEIHVTPLEEIKLSTTSLFIEFYDAGEKRWRASFSPYQAFKVTTIDCIDTIPYIVNGKRPFQILEVTESDWIRLLKQTLQKKDHTATFLEEAHHYVFPFQDIIIEVVAWNLQIELCNDFNIDILRFHKLQYAEGDHVLEVSTDFRDNPISFGRRYIKNWLPPYDSEEIIPQKREEIYYNILNYLKRRSDKPIELD